MLRKFIIISIAIVGAAAAADLDATHELGYDTGRAKCSYEWLTGLGFWVANDFNISTLKSTGWRVTELGFYSIPPFDGFRIALWGSAPDRIIWPTSGVPKFVKPAAGPGWVWLKVDHTLEAERKYFYAGVEQFFNRGQADAHYYDDNPAYQGHAFERRPGRSWQPTTGVNGYKNVMIRVRITDDPAPAVASTSLGRVRAVFW